MCENHLALCDYSEQFFLYINCIIHCKIRRDNHQVPKILKHTGIKQILRKENKNVQIMQVTKINTEWADS